MVYAYQPVNPLNAFAQSFEMVRGIQDQNAARQQAQMELAQKRQRQQDLKTAIDELRINPTPEKVAEFGLRFPEMNDGVKTYYQALSESKKATQREVAQKIVIAQRTGGDVAAILERYAEAAENARDPQMAKEFRDAAAFAKENPEAAAETAKLRLAFTDPDAYKTVYSTTMYDTAKIKEALAEGLEYGTPKFQARMKELNDRDPYISVPGVGLFRRDQVDAAASGGQSQVTPDIPEAAVQELIRRPDTAKFFDQEFGAGAAARILGGGGSNATGGFR